MRPQVCRRDLEVRPVGLDAGDIPAPSRHHGLGEGSDMRAHVDDDVAGREALRQSIFVVDDHPVEDRLIQRAVPKRPRLGHETPLGRARANERSRGFANVEAEMRSAADRLDAGGSAPSADPRACAEGRYALALAFALVEDAAAAPTGGD